MLNRNSVDLLGSERVWTRQKWDVGVEVHFDYLFLYFVLIFTIRIQVQAKILT